MDGERRSTRIGLDHGPEFAATDRYAGLRPLAAVDHELPMNGRHHPLPQKRIGRLSLSHTRTVRPVDQNIVTRPAEPPLPVRRGKHS